MDVVAGNGMSTDAAAPRRRLEWIDQVKGLAMVAVVFGHSLAGLIDAGISPQNGWFRTAFIAIYLAHMPLFFFLSGLFVKSRVERSPKSFLASLAKTIVFPYFLWASIQLVVIGLAGSFANKPAGDIVQSIAMLPVLPPAQFWFLYVLCLAHLIAVAIVPRFGPLGLLIVAIALTSIPNIPGLPYFVNLLCRMAPYYAMGVILGSRSEFMDGVSRLSPLTWILALVAAGVGIYVASNIAVQESGPAYWSLESAHIASLGWKFRNFSVAIMVILALCALAARFEEKMPALIGYIGAHSMSIYVLHIIFIAGTRIATTRILHVRDANLLLGLSIVIGLFGPLIVRLVAARLHIDRKVALY